MQWAAARNEEPQSSCFKHVNSEQSKHGKCGGMPHDATCWCPQGGTHCNAEPMKTSKPNEAEAWTVYIYIVYNLYIIECTWRSRRIDFELKATAQRFLGSSELRASEGRTQISCGAQNAFPIRSEKPKSLRMKHEIGSWKITRSAVTGVSSADLSTFIHLCYGPPSQQNWIPSVSQLLQANWDRTCCASFNIFSPNL